MPLPAVINPTDTFQTWLDATNNTISELTNTSIFIRTGSSNVATGNVHVNGTFHSSMVSVNAGAVFAGTWFNVSSNIAATGANIVFGGTDVKVSSNTLFIGAVNIITSNLVVGNAAGSLLTVNATMSVTKAATFSNTVTVSGNFASEAAMTLSGPMHLSNTYAISANLTSNAASFNDYAPTALANAVVVRITPDVDGTVITGFTIADATRYRKIHIENVGNYTINLIHESASSTANNRLALPSNSNMSFIKQSGIILLYDPISLRWRVVSSSAAATGDLNTLTVVGLATFQGNVSIAGTLTVNGATALSNSLTVTGFANLLSTLQVTGNTQMANSLTVTGFVSFANTLTLTGAATLNSNTFANGHLRLDTTNGRIVLPVGVDKWAS